MFCGGLSAVDNSRFVGVFAVAKIARLNYDEPRREDRHPIDLQ